MSRTQARERNWERNHGHLFEAAHRAGIDPQILVKIAGFESNFDTTARPVARVAQRNTVRQWDGTMAISSAYGLGQFLDGTWLDMVRRHGEKYGVENARELTRAQANAPGIRNDPHLQAAMLAEFTRENIAAGARLGGPDPDANVYAMHNLGAADATKFLAALRTDPGMRADRLLSAAVIRGNPSLYGDGSRTLAQAYRAMGDHMDAYAPFAARIRPDAAAPARETAVSPPDAGLFPHPPRLPDPAEASGAPAGERASIAPRSSPGAIYDAAHRHFFASGLRFEYGRGDTQAPNRGGNKRTDPSRNERDLDGDGMRGVDCSSFVWRALHNSGYAVPANSTSTPFTTYTLFNGPRLTPFAQRNFEAIPASEASRDHGPLRRGDILLFKDKNSAGQHVGIFKGYDAQGGIEFIGSQVTTGPAAARAGRGSYWNGAEFEIVGALRARPEFQVRAPLHAGDTPDSGVRRVAAAARAGATGERTHEPVARAAQGAQPPVVAVGMGDRGPGVATLQRRLAELDYRGRDGRPLRIDADFGENTRFALQAFQREHGLDARDVAGPRTAAALERAERALVSHPSHAHHGLYADLLDKVRSAERARGMPSGRHSERVAGALAVECVREGIACVDRVELNRDASLVRAVQVSGLRDEPGLNRSTDGISAPQASLQPLAESSQQLDQVAVNRRAQEQEMRRQGQEQESRPQREQARAVPAM